MLMNDKIMFDRYYCINSTKLCENKENIGALYFNLTTLSYASTLCQIRAAVKYSSLIACGTGIYAIILVKPRKTYKNESVRLNI